MQAPQLLVRAVVVCAAMLGLVSPVRAESAPDASVSDVRVSNAPASARGAPGSASAPLVDQALVPVPAIGLASPPPVRTSLTSAPSARATPPLVRTPARRSRALAVSMIAWAAGVAADQTTTFEFSSGYRAYLREANPLLHPLDRHPALLVGAGVALDATTGWLVNHLAGRRHPRLAMLAFLGAGAYRAYLARYNWTMMRQARRWR